MAMFEDNAQVQTSSVNEVDINLSQANLDTKTISQSTTDFDIPQADPTTVSTFDVDELAQNPDAPEANTPPSAIDYSTDPRFSAPTKTTETLPNTPESVTTNPVSAPNAPEPVGIPMGDGLTGTQATENIPAAPEPVSVPKSGEDTRPIYASDVEYEAPYTPTSESDMDIEHLVVSPEDLRELLGKMSKEEYEEFIKGIQEYYGKQLDYFDYLLNGDGENLGYLDYIDWIMDFLEEHQLFTRPYFDVLNDYDSQAHALLDRYNYSYTADWFARRFPEAGITYQEFLDMSRDDQWQFLLDQNDEEAKQIVTYREAYINNMNEMITAEFGEFGITTYDELMTVYYDLQDNVERINEAIKTTKNLKESAWYDYLPYLKDYNEYDFHQFTEEELQAVRDSLAYFEEDGIYDYGEFHRKYPDISPIDYILAVRRMFPNEDHTYDSYWGLNQNSDDLIALAEVFEVCPQFAKTYSYLYSIDPKEAEKYLKACKYETNAIRGQILAQAFLSQLDLDDGNGDEVLEAIANSLEVDVQGLIDGLEGFGEGVYYSLEALAVALGICEENRVMSVSEYKKMYILQALLPKEAQVKAGLIIDNGDGTYSNNEQNNPFGIIDFTRKYSGLWLHHKYSVAQGIGNMLPSILLSAINPAAGAWALGISAGGNAYHSAMVDGKDYISALFYGLFTGSSEAITEKIFGGLPFLSDVKVTSFASYLKAVGLEAFQESFQGAMDYLYKAMFMGEPFPDLDDAEAWMELLADIGTQGFYGALTAGIMQSPALAKSIFNMHRINHFMNTNGITADQQKAAIDAVRNSNPEFKSLTDAEIKVMFGQQVATQAMINKVAFENNVSNDVAKIMLGLGIDADTAKVMVYENVTLEEAQHRVEQRKLEIVDDEETRQFILDYMNDPSTPIPDTINPQLAEFLEKYRTDPTSTQPFMPESLSNFLADKAIELFYGGEEGYQQFRSEVENEKGIVRTELRSEGLDNWFTSDHRLITSYNSPAYVCAYLEMVIDQYSNWQENGLLRDPYANIDQLDDVQQTISDARDAQILPSQMLDRLQARLEAVKSEYISHQKNSLVNTLKSGGLNAYISQTTGNIVIDGLEPNAKYELTVKVNVPGGHYYTETFVIRTDENGMGTCLDLTAANFLKIANRGIESFENPDITLTYSDARVHGDTNPDYAEQSPFYDIMDTAAGDGFGVNQGTFRSYDFSYDSFYDGDTTTSADDFFLQALEGNVPSQTQLLNQLKQIVRSYLPGISDADIIAYLTKLDSEGACSHAATVNQFILQWSSKPELFRQAFGYDLFRTDSSGRRVLNGDLLLADYYTYLNQQNEGLFSFDGDSPTYKNPDTHSDQVYSSAYKFEEFLNWKLEQSGSDVRVKVNDSYVCSNTSPMEFDTLSESLHKGIHDLGISYNFSFWVDYDKGEKVTMYRYDPDTGLYDIPTTTDEWFENSGDYESGLSESHTAGHATTIIDASSEGLYVQSWGKLYFIPFESLPNSTYQITEFRVEEVPVSEVSPKSPPSDFDF